MNAPFEPAHSPFGGSGAARLMICPASVGRAEKVPPYLRREASAHADRGSALHVAMARLIERECALADLVGMTIDGYTITADDVENALRPVLAHVDALLAPGVEYYLEKRVTFPGIPGAFGTTDLIARIGGMIRVLDFKFGALPVFARYPDGSVNAQLLFYTVAARHSLPAFFVGADDIVLTVLQPQSLDPDAKMESSVEVHHGDLDAFVVRYREVCEEALSESPHLEKGPHCKFCAAKPICPLHTGPLLDLAAFELSHQFGIPPD